MSKYIFLLSFLLLLPLTVFAAKVEFTADTELDMTGLPVTLYVQSGSECDLLYVSASGLGVVIPDGSLFILKTPSYRIGTISPSGGSLTLSTANTYLRLGYLTQWTASASPAATKLHASIGVPTLNVNYHVTANGTSLGYFVPNPDGLISFTYDKGFSSVTFKITREEPTEGGGIVAPAPPPEKIVKVEKPKPPVKTIEEIRQEILTQMVEILKKLIKLYTQLIQLLNG